MLECAYGREPLDCKLLLLRLTKKIWIVVLSALCGALLAGGLYFLCNIAGRGPVYEAVTNYYVDYGTDPLTNNTFTYINGVTWNDSWVKSDLFLDSILERTGAEAERLLGHPMTKEELKSFLSATLETDLRMPFTFVRTGNPELTMLLCRALEEMMQEFGETQKEIVSISLIISPTEASLVTVDNRTVNACILGAILGAFFSLVILLMALTMDDSIYIPATFEYRYHIPMLGTIASVELTENFTHLFAGKKKIALLSVEEGTDVGETAEALIGRLGEALADRELVCMPGLTHCPEALKPIREADGLLLLVEAGAHDGKLMEHTLQLLAKQDIAVTAALLIHAEEGLQRAYYFGGSR